MKIQIEIVVNANTQELIPEKLRKDYDLQQGDIVMLERSEDQESGQYSYRVLERVRPESMDKDSALLIPEALIQEFGLQEGAYVLNNNGVLTIGNFDAFVDSIPKQVFETCEAIGIDTEDFIELLKECRLMYEDLSCTG